MTLRKLDLAPDQARYTATPGPAVRRVETDGGLARVRLDQDGAPSQVDCRWVADAGEHDYLLAFYRTVAHEGDAPFQAARFLIDLWLDGFPMLEYEARFLPPGPTLGGQSGGSYLLTARLEASPIERDAEADQDLIDSYAPAVDGLQVMGLSVGSASYSAQRGDELLTARPGLGPAAVRAGLERSTASVRVSWTTNAGGYAYLVAFYYTATRECALPFRIGLVLDRSELTDYVAAMVPGSFSLDSVNGGRFRVSAGLEVLPLPRDADYDASLVELFPIYGDELGALLLSLESLVNVHLPEIS